MPALVMDHVLDACPNTPPGNAAVIAKRMTKSPRVAVKLIEGGTRPRVDRPCGGFGTYHGYYGVDDGILASCKFVEIAARATGPVSALFDSVPHLHATPELKAPCSDAEKFKVIDALARDLKQRYETIDIDGARVMFPGGGWGLVRASNTNPYLTLRFEAKTEREIEDMKRVIYDALKRFPYVTLPA